MQTFAVSEAKAKLTSLTRRAEAGEEISLTRHGRVIARIVPPLERPSVDRVKLRRELFEIARGGGELAAKHGWTSQSLQDEFYDDAGLPI